MTGRRCGIVAAAAGLLFAALAALLASRAWAPFGFEQSAIDWCAAHRPTVARLAALAVTSLGTGAVPYALALAAGGVTLRAVPGPRSRRTAAVVLLAPVAWLAVGQLVRQGLMHAFGRPRPPEADWATVASGFSFPSGHTFTSAVSAGLLALAIVRVRPALARPAVAGAALFAAAVGLSRVYLCVHWPLDILGGWLLAAGWLALAVPAAALGGYPPRRSTVAAAPQEGPPRPQQDA
ncbi:phosphatase PAP2 family protein [Kitasatospora sp. NPDC059571]|uniref:phosphatase PAP2 family protein n=1 Tax=Kitasatospora sp. NPDC059571 TaxID=3346871 RepID=UPI0036C8A9FC